MASVEGADGTDAESWSERWLFEKCQRDVTRTLSLGNDDLVINLIQSLVLKSPGLTAR